VWRVAARAGAAREILRAAKSQGKGDLDSCAVMTVLERWRTRPSSGKRSPQHSQAQLANAAGMTKSQLQMTKTAVCPRPFGHWQLVMVIAVAFVTNLSWWN